jgi:predicted DNA-binding ribbon-helix-helix protein
MVSMAPVNIDRSGRAKGVRRREAKGAGRATERPLERMFALCPADPSREYLPVRRSIRLHGHSTTLRLERALWGVLEELSSQQGITLAQLVTKIYDHCLGTDQKNLASCLRVVCLKYIETCR